MGSWKRSCISIGEVEIEGTATVPGTTTEVKTTSRLDGFAKAKVRNFWLRVGHCDPEFTVDERDGTFVAELELPLPAAFGCRRAVGMAPSARDAEVAAAMHATHIIDALGIPLFTLPSKQQRHASAAASEGRWAPEMGDDPRSPATRSPPGVRFVSGPEDSHRFTLTVTDAPPFRTSPHTLLSAGLLDNHSSHRLRQWCRAHGGTLQALVRDSSVHEDGVAWSVVTLALGDVVPKLPDAQGTARSPNVALALACMHAELLLDAAGVPLFPSDSPKQDAHLADLQQHSADRAYGSGSVVLPLREALGAAPSTVSAGKFAAHAAACTGLEPSQLPEVPERWDAHGHSVVAAYCAETRQQALELLHPVSGGHCATTSVSFAASHLVGVGVGPTIDLARKASAAHTGAQLVRAGAVSNSFDVPEQMVPCRGLRLGTIAPPTARSTHPAEVPDVARQSKGQSEADTSDGFLVVEPLKTASSNVCIADPRELDERSVKRVTAFLLSLGKRLASLQQIKQRQSPNGETCFRAEIRIPLPRVFGEQVAIGEAMTAKVAEALACMHAELLFDAAGVPLYVEPQLQQRHAEAAARFGRRAPMPGDPHASPTVTFPCPLRQRQLQTFLDAAQRLVPTGESVPDVVRVSPSELETASRLRIQSYLRRLRRKSAVSFGDSSAARGFAATMQVPVPARFGPRFATGLAPTKREAEVLCYMHAERIVDGLGIALFALPGMQARHARRVRDAGRWAVSDADARVVPSHSATPPPLMIDGMGVRPKPPHLPAAAAPEEWAHVLGECEVFVTNAELFERNVSIEKDSVPRTGNTLLDATLAATERMDLDRHVKAKLMSYCTHMNLEYPQSWRSSFVGPENNRKCLTHVTVPGFEHIDAMGMGANKDVSHKRASMHALSLLRHLDPDFSLFEESEPSAAGESDVGVKKKRTTSQHGSYDRSTRSFTVEGKSRLVNFFALCNEIAPPRTIHRQRTSHGRTVHVTCVELELADGHVIRGRANDAGRRTNEAAAFDDLFEQLYQQLPGFRALGSLLRAHPHLDPDHIATLELPRHLAEEIESIAHVTEAEESVLDAEESQGVEDTTQALASSLQAEPDQQKQARFSKYLTALREKRLESPTYREEFQPKRDRLSIHAHRQTILDTVRDHPVTVLCGTTGCGKTTQVPQFLLDEATDAGDGALCRVLVTQPRRISAISIAQRIAAERLEGIGENVGYTIRLDSKPGRCINFCTSGVLLRLFQADSNLDGVSHVIIDEIHERDINSDFLLILIRELVQRRPSLRVILMSATLQSELFAGYFHGAPVINVEGYVFPVKELFLEDVAAASVEDGVQSPLLKAVLKGDAVVSRSDEQDGKYGTVEVAEDIDYPALLYAINYAMTREDLSGGSVLVFLPGWDEIVKTRDHLLGRDDLDVILLHSSVGNEDQLKCFAPAPKGKTKIVLSTNIAESGVTIDDVGAVIDVGRAKEKSFLMRKGRTAAGRNDVGTMSQLVTVLASKANSTQRRGRVGRTRPGVSIRLYPREQFDCLPEFQVPEMLRQPLDSLCLQIIALGLGNPVEFLQHALEPPPLESIQAALVRLHDLGAISEAGVLTFLGRRLAMLPVAPRVGKMVLYGAALHCLDPVLTLAATIDVDPFLGHREAKDAVRAAKDFFAGGCQSDHLSSVNAFNTWAAIVQAGDHAEAVAVAEQNSLSLQSLPVISKYKQQYYDILQQSGFIGAQTKPAQTSAVFIDHSEYSANALEVGLVKGVLCAGLFPNVAVFRDKKILRNKLEHQVQPHGGSVVAKLESHTISNPFFVFEEMMKTATDNRIMLKGVSNVGHWGIILLGTSTRTHIQFRDDLSLAIVDGWLMFRTNGATLDLVYKLKSRLSRCIERKFVSPDDDANNKLLVRLREVVREILSMPATPNHLSDVVWEDKGEIVSVAPPRADAHSALTEPSE